MVIEKLFHIFTNCDVNALEGGWSGTYAQGIISDPKSTSSQMWNIVPYIKNGIILFLLVNEDNSIMAHYSLSSVLHGYNPEKIIPEYCWILDYTDDGKNIIFRTVDGNYNASQYVLSANENIIGEPVSIAIYNKNDYNQRWEIIPF
ncbi:hypothetical protein [Clostridium saccharoperbutylacetonicum]